MQPGKWYPSTSRILRTTCGEMFLVIDRDPETDIIKRVHLFGGKPGTCASSQNNTICKLLTALMKLQQKDRIKVLNEIIGVVCNQIESCSSQALRIIYDQTINERRQ